MCYIDVDFHSWISLYHRHLETITDYKVLYGVLPGKCIWVKVTKWESSVLSHLHKFHFPFCFICNYPPLTGHRSIRLCVTPAPRGFKSPRLRGTPSLALLASTFSTQP